MNKLNQLLFKFLWNGTDKVTRVSVINDYEKGGLKMIDLESMVKSLRLAWLKRLFNDSNATWKTYLLHLLKPVGGKFFLNCNYEVSDYTISSQFYQERLLWWSEFRESFASERDWKIIVWNNKEIRIDNKPVYYKNFLKSGIIYIHDLLFDLNTTDSYNYFSNKIDKSNFLQWAGLRHSVPSHLKKINLNTSTISPSQLLIGNKIFDIKDRKSKDYYSLLVSKKAQLPNIIHKLKSDFNFTTQQLKEIFSLPHLVALESYVKAFQYKVINSILYTNSKLCKIGFRINDACTFCNDEPENFYHFFYECYECSHSKTFWTDFESYWYYLSCQPIHLSEENVLFGIL